MNTWNTHLVKKLSSPSVVQIIQLQKKRFLTDTNFTTARGKFTFKYKTSEENGDKKTKLPKINEQLDEHVLTPNFKYYQTHDFHKLSAKKAKEKTFSLMHTNICSLNTNVKHLDILLDQLDFSFDLLAVSETWTAKLDHVKNIPRLENYQSFVGTKEVTTKSGCCFYIRNDIKYKQRTDLDISYFDDNNEFQSSWIEIIKENEPNIIAGVLQTS